MTKEEKDWIDNSTYADLLRRWRFSPSSDKIFHGESGDYYKKVMGEKKKQVNNPSQISKLIGF